MSRIDNKQVKEGAAGKISAGLTTAKNHTLIRTQAELLMQKIPQDTRNKTQRLLGDPIIERSALYKWMSENRDR